jgi:phosphoheptose isomerase
MTEGVAKAALLAAREALDELIANEVVLGRIDEASRLLIRTLETNGRVFSCGNGGSSSKRLRIFAFAAPRGRLRIGRKSCTSK